MVMGLITGDGGIDAASMPICVFVKGTPFDNVARLRWKDSRALIQEVGVRMVVSFSAALVLA